MAPPPKEEGPWDLPRPRISFCLENDNRYIREDPDTVGSPEFYDAKFCPFQPLNAAPVFAGLTRKHVVLCRLNATEDSGPTCEVLRVIRDDDPEASDYCCTWTKDHETGRPYLCVAGVDAKVKVYDVTSGKLIKCLVGHGGVINDLTTSPADPLIIASASDDTTVRIWSMHPAHSKQPCLCILGGQAHSWNLLTVGFHDTGRYILSSGHDHIINFWTLPELAKGHVECPVQVYYPHFSSSEIHGGMVDCVAFYGDNILSRACHDDVIVLWRIEGFSSRDPPPPPGTAPTSYDSSRSTRSAFVPAGSSACPAQYTRLMEFQTPGCGVQIFMRFGLYFQPGEHPVLAFCNCSGRIFFWDLARITAYQEFSRRLEGTGRNPDDPVVPRPRWLQLVPQRQKQDPLSKVRDASDRDSIDSGQTGATAQTEADRQGRAKGAISEETVAAWEAKYNPENPHHSLEPHKVEYFGQSHFLGRRAIWSPGGEWCVVVGSSNLALILQRWSKWKA